MFRSKPLSINVPHGPIDLVPIQAPMSCRGRRTPTCFFLVAVVGLTWLAVVRLGRKPLHPFRPDDYGEVTEHIPLPLNMVEATPTSSRSPPSPSQTGVVVEGVKYDPQTAAVEIESLLSETAAKSSAHYTHNSAALRTMDICLQEQECRSNSKCMSFSVTSDVHSSSLVIIFLAEDLSVSRFRGHEYLETRSILRALDALGIIYVFSPNDVQWAQRVYRLFPDQVKALVMDARDIEDCLKDRINCVRTPNNLPGIPIWKMLHWNKRHIIERANPLGEQWSLSLDRDPSNNKTYVGYSMESNCAKQLPHFTPEERLNRVYILATLETYFAPHHTSWDPEFFETFGRSSGIPFVASLDPVEGRLKNYHQADGLHLVPSNLVELGTLSFVQTVEEMARSKLMLGLWDPREESIVLENLCMGVPFLNPVGNWDHSNPEDRTQWTVQHTSLIDANPPYVYHVFAGDRTGFERAINDALSHPIESYIPPWMSESALEQRLLRDIIHRDWKAEAQARILADNNFAMDSLFAETENIGRVDDEAGVDPLEGEGLSEDKLARLEAILERTTMYSEILKKQMDEARVEHLSHMRRKQAEKAKEKNTSRSYPRKRRRTDEAEEAVVSAEEDEDTGAFPQPALVTGATLKDYQLEGLQWMVSLNAQGISGILADEMGLGKTLQTIAFAAHLRELGTTRPFLVVCPLSVMHNWVDEFKRFAPKIPVLMYHGTPVERAELRRTAIPLPDGWGNNDSKATPVASSSKGKKTAARGKGKGKGRGAAAKKRKRGDRDDVDEQKLSEEPEQDPEEAAIDAHFRAFPVVITTYELIMKDRSSLSAYPWGYIVVDEGHRLKNMHCALIREVKKYESAGRMILTGTPLHNNLAELWSLLNFILPDIFDDVDSFQEWFSPNLSSGMPSERMGAFIVKLHAILKPFLLRRVKADVLGSALPPKKSYVLYAKMSKLQHEAYEAIVSGNVRAWVTGSTKTVEPASVETENEEVGLRTRQAKARARPDGQDDLEEAERRRVADEFARRGIAKQLSSMNLQNKIMQLRKVCSHPFLFSRPDDEIWTLGRSAPTQAEIAAREAELVGGSGKMLLLDRLLVELFRRGHKVLLFSQFTTMLDIIEDWAVDMKGWTICRIDGSTPPLERREQMNLFQSAGDRPDAPRLFLLSTRSGGLGVNLTAADTVIFYDQDWNPQMDAQAQDRAHRIGQTRPVLIFRLVTAHSIEEKIMEKATEKRKLEALVIARGKFKRPTGADGRRTTTAEMAADLLRLEREDDVLPSTLRSGKGNTAILSDEDLEALLDRSPEVFVDRGSGWTAGQGRTAFAVFDGPAADDPGALAGMMAEEPEEA
ncbi:unnamed protein product [Mycena citricolor]|uniref:Uncharacterized protein n=1 Tax=Mycena citricolor TaxID=2018698 RepID=A0AAD2Q2P2_9AGAR|nr:unnamed protein product [Mycena citricolor]